MAQNRASNNSSPFRTETALCFGARESCGAMGIRRAFRHHTAYGVNRTPCVPPLRGCICLRL